MFRPILATALALLTPLAARAAGDERPYDLMVGDPAPALTGEGVNGRPIDGLRDDTTYVVECWATWCGPCVGAMPHLSELQAEYADRNVRFVGVNVWEEDTSKVRPFVEKMGDKMAYTVAMDIVPEADAGKGRPVGKMAESWMAAAGRKGIPSSFVVQKGRVQWIGHPGELDEPLEQIVGGRWDLAAAARKHHDSVAAEAALDRLGPSLQTAMRAGKWSEAVASIDAVLEQYPGMEQNVAPQRLFCLVRSGDKERSTAYAEKLADGLFKSSPQGLNFIASTIVNPEHRDLGLDAALAVRVAKKANVLTGWKEPVVLDTYASALALAGDVEQAVEIQEKAVKLSIGTQMEADLKRRLEELRAKRSS
jgi:thiol-disulfide isomerase/thioredoxin